MYFDLDKQTIKDLELFGDGSFSHTIFDFYNQTKTAGGKEYLWYLMKKPTADIEELESRVALIKYLGESEFHLELDFKQFEYIEYYLKLNIPPLSKSSVDVFFKNFSARFRSSNDFHLIQKGIHKTSQLIIEVERCIQNLDEKLPQNLKEKIAALRDFISISEIRVSSESEHPLSFLRICKIDNLLRGEYKNRVIAFIEVLYSVNAYLGVSSVALRNKLYYPEYSNSSDAGLYIKKLYHPLLENAVPYDLEFTAADGLCFLTGPNMAGKSTFLKSVGLSIYLSHLGFPVPAEKMRTSIYDGIVTTINITDSMSQGYSHFYSEVRRIKEVALKLKAKKKLLVIFDELFRGTNVKDAYDASLTIIEAFGRIKGSTFFVSTHIIEIAEKLSGSNNMLFKCFESELIDNKPAYNYQIKNGVSHERVGLQIVENEKIVEILDSIAYD